MWLLYPIFLFTLIVWAIASCSAQTKFERDCEGKGGTTIYTTNDELLCVKKDAVIK